MSAVQVILLERIEKLGQMGDVVSVKPGYARNCLLPTRKALRASKENIAYFEAQRKSLEAENDKKRSEAEKLAKKIEGIKIPLIRQASESGQLYGSVATRDIAEQLAEQSGLDIARSMIDLNQNFKMIGLFNVDVILHPEVKVNLTVNIARSQEEAEIQAATGEAVIADEGEILEEVVAEAAEEAEEAMDEQLSGVLEEGALEAEKTRQVQDAEKAAEEATKSEAKAAAKAEKDAAKADAEAEVAEASDDAASEDSASNDEAEKDA